MDVSGDGELASSSTQAQLIVQHNDDPINLNGTLLEASEGDIVELVITRGGHANGRSRLSFVVVTSTYHFIDRCSGSII